MGRLVLHKIVKKKRGVGSGSVSTGWFSGLALDWGLYDFW